VKILLLSIFLLACSCPPKEHNQYFSCLYYLTNEDKVFICLPGLNELWLIYGVDEHPTINGYLYTPNPAWAEWDSIKLAWTSYRDVPMEHLTKYTVYNSGFASSWGFDSPTWPSGGAHYDQLPRIINATYNYFVWSGDFDFLHDMYPKLKLILDYMISHSEDGLFVTPCPSPSNYMDQIRFCHKDAWINAALYTSIKNMAEIEEFIGGNDSTYYRKLEKQFHEDYNEAFWDQYTGRYIGWINSDGARHDYGFPFISLEALYRGLGDYYKAYRIFYWIESNERYLYYYKIAPRTNMNTINEKDWDDWSGPVRPRMFQNGGTLMWFAYYDIMARLKYTSKKDAFEKLIMLVKRLNSDSEKLTFNNRNYTDFGESITEIGTNQGPENGIALLPFLYGFMGITADTSGIHIKPNLPKGVGYMGARKINYMGEELSVHLFAEGEIVISMESIVENVMELFK